MASTFKVGLSIDSELNVSFVLKPVIYMHKLMERVEKYKKLEDDQLQDKAKAKAPMKERREVRMDHPPWPRRHFFP